MCNRIMEFASNGGTLFHHDQLLLTFLVSVQRQCCGELFNQSIDQLLLIVTEMTPVRQGGEQNTVLGMRIGQPPFQRSATINGGQCASWTQMTTFFIATGTRLAGKFLMIIFIFQVINAQLNIVQQR